MLAALLLGCTPTAAGPTPTVVPTAIEPLAAATPTIAPALSATPAPTAVATATADPTATPEPTATPQPATPRPTVEPTPEPGPVRNDGQKIVATFDPPQRWFFGEAGGSAATQVSSYTLNGASLAGSALKCAEQKLLAGNYVCTGVVIIPAIRLLSGQRYELRLVDDLLGTFTARGLVAGTPHVLAVTANQFDLTVKFDRPMLHVGDCGTQSWSLGIPGTIEYVRGSQQVFPAPVGAYTSSSAGYRDFLSAFISAADISADCTTVKLGSGWGGPTGPIDITISGVEDVYGNFVQPRTFSVVIDDQGPPKLMFAQLELQTALKKVIRVAYSEAMDQEYVTDPQRYYLNGTLIPPTTLIECELANCAWIRLTFAPTTFAYGADNTLTIIGVHDMAGNAMSPDIVTSGTFQVR